MMSKVSWGILGAGNISSAFAAGLAQTESARLKAVASRQLEKAEEFCRQLNLTETVQCYANYDDLLADATVDAVYIGLPHTEHLHWSVKALRAGKHVLCEKPLGLNHAEAMLAYAEAERAGKILMEAFMYRCTAQTAKLIDLLKEGVIGEIRQIQASFCYSSTPRPGSRTWEPELAGGGILDVGCYPLSMAGLIAGVALGKTYAEPVELQAMGQIGSTGVDDWAVANLRYSDKLVAQIATAINAEQEESLRIAGTKGALVLPNPWYGNGQQAGSSRIDFYQDESLQQSWTITAELGMYAAEAEVFAQAVATQAIPYPALSAADSLTNLKVMDAWRQQLGLTYPKERLAAFAKDQTLAGLALRQAEYKAEYYDQIAGLNKPISRLVMGVDNQETHAHAFALFDDYLERGGNTFDTAWVYDFDGGHCEQIFGDWLQRRQVRDQIVLISKGAHTPNCTPDGMRKEFAESLQRLQTDAADIYMLHRDNPAVPVGEFIDVLNQHVAAGKFKVFGASNWSLSRIAEANQYAAQHGLQGFTVVSNQLSLARMLSPVWGGCVSVGDDASLKKMTEMKLALFAWSSQARGFFTDRAGEHLLGDAELVRCWYSAENFERRRRAQQLAQQYGVSAITVALAWVLQQAFPCFSLIGPRSVQETASSFKALNLRLSQDESAWLNLATDN